ncbi:MAG: 3-oxoacyl-ACP reductase FabG [bacterium]|nr:3-oxoacyl-ACP reductase FabG [bacterium]MCP5068565.1 3-oxoacyl-ACP reductase FabG [bacterium]
MSTCTAKRHVLVTGGSRGIGRATALALARAGYPITITWCSREEAANDVVAALGKLGVAAGAIRLDTGCSDQIPGTFLQANEERGPIQVLVNNAAIVQEKPFDDLDLEDWDRMQAVNLRGPFLCAREVVPGMRERGWGRIINVSSIGGQWGGIRQVHYAAAKAGLISLTRSLARIGAADGITVNAVAPGLIETEMIADELASSDGRAKAAGIPVGRIGTPEEVADSIAFLASDAAAYVTGQTLNVNGGMYFG